MTTWRRDKIGTKSQFFFSSSPYWYQLLELVFLLNKRGTQILFPHLNTKIKYAACHRQKKALFGVSAKSPPLLLPGFFAWLKKQRMTWTKQLVKSFWLNYHSKFWSPYGSLLLAGDFCHLDFVVTFGFVKLVTWIFQTCYMDLSMLFYVILPLC